MRRLLAGLLALFGAHLATPAAAQQTLDGVAAVVNEEAITLIEVEMRTRLALVASNLENTVEVRRRIVPQVLRRLIDERLQLQEAKRLQISVSDDDINKGIATIEAQNRVQPGTLLASLERNGVSPQAMRRQVEAEIAWLKVMRLRLLPTIKVGEDEIDARLERLKANLGQPEFLLAEIVLGVTGPEDEAEVRRTAERIIEQLRAGVPFAAMARQFSQSASAANGGDLGWVPQDTLDREMLEAVTGLRPGELAGPLRTLEGFQIILLRDRRVFGAGDAGDVELALAQLLIPQPSDRTAAEARLKALATEIKSCADMETVAKRENLPGSGRLGNVKAANLPAGLRQVLLDLPVLQPSEPLDTPEGVRVMMVCGRSGGSDGAGLPDRDAIRQQIENERLEMLGRRYMRDLQRSAFIEVRL